MSAEISQVNFRMPTALKERLEREARTNERSLTAEIIYRLQTTLEMDDYVPKENANQEMPASLDDIRAETRRLIELLERIEADAAK